MCSRNTILINYIILNYLTYILVNRQISIKYFHIFIHIIILVISTYQHTFPHYPQNHFELFTPFCVKANTTYRFTTSYPQLIHNLCISTDVRLDNPLKILLNLWISFQKNYTKIKLINN